jgi:TonB family protein
MGRPFALASGLGLCLERMARPDTRAKPHPDSPVQPPTFGCGPSLALFAAVLLMGWSAQQYFFDDLTLPNQHKNDVPNNAEPGPVRSSPIMPAPVEGRPGTSRARANLASYVNNDDYPEEALSRDEQGIVGFKLDVDQAGRVSRCTVTASSGSASLDSATCRIMTSRARFSPATDDAGRPVGDSINSHIRWQIEG